MKVPCPEATGLALFLRPPVLFFSCQSCSVGLAGSQEERKLKEEEGKKQHLGFLQLLSGKPVRSQAFGLFICKDSYRAIELVLVAAESCTQQQLETAASTYTCALWSTHCFCTWVSAR